MFHSITSLTDADDFNCSTQIQKEDRKSRRGERL